MTSSTRAHHRSGWSHAAGRPADGLRADVVVTQPVEDQGEQFPGGGHDADVAATAGGDPIPVLPQAGMGADALHGLDRRPAHQPRTLFRDPAAVHGGVGFVVFRVSPAHEASCSGRWKRVMSPISATNTAASTSPTPGICWIAR
jgi:hypothetical protein